MLFLRRCGGIGTPAEPPHQRLPNGTGEASGGRPGHPISGHSGLGQTLWPQVPVAALMRLSPNGRKLVGRHPRRQIVTIRLDLAVAVSGHKQSISDRPEAELPCFVLLTLSVPATSRTESPSWKSSAACFSTGGRKSKSSHRTPAVSSAEIASSFASNGAAASPQPDSAVFKVNFESRTLFRRVILRSSQSDDRVESVLTSRRAALPPVCTRVMDE